MQINLRIFLIVSICVYLGIILTMLRRKNMDLRYALVWIFSGFVMLLVSVFPDIIYWIAKIIGVVDSVNIVFVLEGIFVLMILLSITAIVSHLNGRVRALTQSVSIMEKRIRELENKTEHK